MRQPKAICFDMGYTLMRHSAAGPELYRKILRENGLDYSLKELEAAHVPARNFYLELARKGVDFESSMDRATTFWLGHTRGVLTDLGVAEADRSALAERINTEAWSPQAWELFPEVVDTLQALQDAGYRMAIISNFVDTLQALCDVHGLSRFFESILPSVEAGSMKPDQGIFVKTLRRLDVDAADAWHVGDNYWADVLGSRAAGMVPVFLDRDGVVARADCAHVRTIDELLILLEDGRDSEAAA